MNAIDPTGTSCTGSLFDFCPSTLSGTFSSTNPGSAQHDSSVGELLAAGAGYAIANKAANIWQSNHGNLLASLSAAAAVDAGDVIVEGVGSGPSGNILRDIPRNGDRPLLPSDLGSSRNVDSLVGTIGITGRNLNINIDYIDGRGGVIKQGIAAAIATAKANGLTNINITAIIANEKLGILIFPDSSLFKSNPGTRFFMNGTSILIQIPVR